MNNPLDRKPYTGILAEPLERQPVGLALALMPDSRKETFAVARTDALMKRLDALFSWYGIQFGDFQSLAFSLATAHVPGFSLAEPKAERRKRGGTPTVDYYGIGTAVLKLTVEQGLTKEKAYRQLAKSKQFGDVSAASIKRYFKEVSRRTKTPEASREFLKEMTLRTGAAWWGDE